MGAFGQPRGCFPENRVLAGLGGADHAPPNVRGRSSNRRHRPTPPPGVVGSAPSRRAGCPPIPPQFARREVVTADRCRCSWLSCGPFSTHLRLWHKTTCGVALEAGRGETLPRGGPDPARVSNGPADVRPRRCPRFRPTTPRQRVARPGTGALSARRSAKVTPTRAADGTAQPGPGRDRRVRQHPKLGGAAWTLMEDRPHVAIPIGAEGRPSVPAGRSGRRYSAALPGAAARRKRRLADTAADGADAGSCPQMAAARGVGPSRCASLFLAWKQVGRGNRRPRCSSLSPRTKAHPASGDPTRGGAQHALVEGRRARWSRWWASTWDAPLDVGRRAETLRLYNRCR